MGLVECQVKWAAEFVSRQLAIIVEVAAFVEPPTVFWVCKIPFRLTYKFIARHRVNFTGAGAVTRSSRRRPVAHFPFLVENQAVRAVVLEHREVILELVPLDTPVKTTTVGWMSVVTGTGANEVTVRRVGHHVNRAGTVHNTRYAERGAMEGRRHCDHLSAGRLQVQVGRERTHDSRSIGAGELVEDVPDGVDERKGAVAAGGVEVVVVQPPESDSGQVSQENIFALNSDAGLVVVSDPSVVLESERSSFVLFPI